MYTKLTQYPAIRFLLVIIVGTILGILTTPGITTIIIIFGSVLLLSIIFIIKGIYNIPYYLLGLSVGLWLSMGIDNPSVKSPNKILPEQPALIEGKIEKTLKHDDNYYKCIVQGSIDTKVLPKLNDIKFILSVTNKNNYPLDLKAGTSIFAVVKARLPLASQLPEEFSEKQYFTSLDVNWYARANSRQVSCISQNHDFNFYREQIVNIIQNKIEQLFNADIQGIVQALLTGDKSDIPPDVKKLYSFTGTAHVLAVAGLHVGIIASVIFIFLGFLKNRWVKFVAFVILVSLFVIITGIQPSAMRAGLMASVAMLMYTLQRKINLLNIIAFVVIILILFNPKMIYSAAFHMSIASVSGIALLYQPIKSFFSKYIKSTHYLIKYIINSISVTLAASITVSPIVAYYFGIYSIISPLANLLIIPLMSLGMVLSILAVSISFLSMTIAGYYSATAEIVLKIAQRINEFAANIPYSYIDGSVTIIISIFISLLLLYMIFSKNTRLLLFRIGISILLLIMVINLLPPNKNYDFKIIPREQFVAVICPIKTNETFFFLSDRKPSQYPFRDLGMENYLSKYPGLIIIGYNGNAGIAMTDELKKRRRFRVFEVSLQMQERIRNILHINKYIPQLIELN
ncbi:MAG: ComEC/Rec2 family competence protein [FCB group bacterium]